MTDNKKGTPSRTKGHVHLTKSAIAVSLVFTMAMICVVIFMVMPSHQSKGTQNLGEILLTGQSENRMLVCVKCQNKSGEIQNVIYSRISYGKYMFCCHRNEALTHLLKIMVLQVEKNATERNNVNVYRKKTAYNHKTALFRFKAPVSLNLDAKKLNSLFSGNNSMRIPRDGIHNVNLHLTLKVKSGSTKTTDILICTKRFCEGDSYVLRKTITDTFIGFNNIALDENIHFKKGPIYFSMSNTDNIYNCICCNSLSMFH